MTNSTATTLDPSEKIFIGDRTPVEVRTIARALFEKADEIERSALEAEGRRSWNIDWAKSYSGHDRFFLGLQQSTTLGDRLFMHPVTPENETKFGVGRKWADDDKEFAHEILAHVEVISTSRNSDGAKVALVAEIA